VKLLLILSLTLTCLYANSETPPESTATENTPVVEKPARTDKKFRIGGFLDFGVEIASTDDPELDDYSGVRFALGPVAYLKLSDRWALRGRLGYKTMNLDSDFGLVLFSFREFELDNSYISLSVGGQIQFTRRFAMSLDYSANINAGGFSCEDISFSPDPAEEKEFCDFLEDDLNSLVHYLKLGLSFETARWLFLEPYIEASINKLGDSYFKNTISTGLNLSFAF